MPPSYRLGAFYFAFFAYAGAYLAWFPLYLAARGFSPAEIAWLVALPSAARIVAPSAWGALADRTGARRGIVLFACAANAACFAAMPFAESFAAMAWLVGVTSLLAAAALPIVEAITFGVLAGQYGRYGPIRLWGSFGFILTVLGGGAWLDAHPVATLPAALLALALATVGVAMTLPRSGPSGAAAQGHRLLVPGVLALLGAGFCSAFGHGSLYAFLTLHLEREGYSGTLIGTLWTLGVLAEILVFLYLPAVFRRWRLSTILVASCALGVARFLVIGWAAHSLWLLVLAQLAHAATFGAFHAAAVACVQRLFPAHALARGQALFSSVSYGAGGAAGALAAGWAWEAAGPGWAFSISSLAALAGILFALRLKREDL